MNRFLDKRYHTFDYEMKKIFGKKVIKLPIDAGFTCPNRDGTKGRDGCIFCLKKPAEGKDILDQMRENREKVYDKWPDAKYIAYFQSNTNTYSDIDNLRSLYSRALTFPDTVGLAIATRADCIDENIADLLYEFSRKTYLFVELGFQSVNKKSIEFINRRYSNDVFEKALELLKKRNINICSHIILNLPNENKEDMLKTVRYLVDKKIWGIKIHMLNVLKNTNLERYYIENQFKFMTSDEYISLVVEILENLPEDMVVNRITGDGEKKDLVEPRWILNKRYILNGVDKLMKAKDTYQGKKYKK